MGASMGTNYTDSETFLLQRAEEILRASAGLTLERATGNEKKIALYAAEKEIECDEREASYRAHIEANSCSI